MMLSRAIVQVQLQVEQGFHDTTEGFRPIFVGVNESLEVFVRYPSGERHMGWDKVVPVVKDVPRAPAMTWCPSPEKGCYLCPFGKCCRQAKKGEFLHEGAVFLAEEEAGHAVH